MSGSAGPPTRFLFLARVLVEVEQEVCIAHVGPDPEGQAVAGREGLADDGDVGAGHEVERGPPVGRRQPTASSSP